jgi:hypothetical protein
MLDALEKAGGFMELPALEHVARQAGQAGSAIVSTAEVDPGGVL